MAFLTETLEDAAVFPAALTGDFFTDLPIARGAFAAADTLAGLAGLAGLGFGIFTATGRVVEWVTGIAGGVMLIWRIGGGGVKNRQFTGRAGWISLSFHIQQAEISAIGKYLSCGFDQSA
jgi:hypothetical protein